MDALGNAAGQSTLFSPWRRFFPATLLALGTLGLGLFGLVPASPSSAAEPQARGLIAAPAAGKVVRSHLVWIKVRRVAGHQTRIRLNGKRIGGDFAPTGTGIIRLRASISHGLRRGLNRLVAESVRRGEVKRRTVRRFRVRTRRPIIGAGRNRSASVGGKVRVAATLEKRLRTSRPVLRWKLVGTPKRPKGKRVPAKLLRPRALVPVLRTRALGTYKLRLTVRRGRLSSSDSVTVQAVHPNKLVPVRTMTSPSVNNPGTPGRGTSRWLCWNGRHSDSSGIAGTRMPMTSSRT